MVGQYYLSVDFPLNIVGHGRLLIKFPNGKVKGINGIFHIPSLT